MLFTLDCERCRELRQTALTASKTYHERLEDLEAAHIRHDSDMLVALSTRLEAAFQDRNAALAKLTDHESTHGTMPKLKSARAPS